ncbi:MAG: methionyl aminopeptidase [Lachnospiraceae bacterium]|nr:methionyl aminopeptidase [Lachnospiraceae bacterium]
MFHKLGRNDDCWCGSGVKYKHCHADYDAKLEKFKARGCLIPPRKIIKNQEQIQGMRDSGKINIAVLDAVAEKICEGMTTEEINTIVHEKTISMGGIPAPLGYQGFPKSVCTSINDQVCHGIPSGDVKLKSGDIINVDVSTIYKGYFSDSSRMFCIGEVSPEKERLVRVTKECVEKGLEMVKPWTRLGDMGYAVHQHALQHGYTVVREVGGHGVGLEFHEDPYVGYTTEKNTGMLMTPGMSFTIEPMVNMGTDEIFVDEENEWTIYTEDRKPSAQWEVMVLVTEEGYELIAY